jgi:hypothetical protein
VRIIIIDMQEGRRAQLDSLAKAVTQDVVSVEAYGDIAAGGAVPDLVLLHVGDNQATAMGDDIASILETFLNESWVLCYTGGIPVQAAKLCPSPNVAVFAATVDPDHPEDDFLRTVQHVLSALQQRGSLPENWLRLTVAEFDPILEAKLDLLAAILQTGEPPAAKRVAALRERYPKAFREGGDLVVDRDHSIQTVARLRKILFQELCEHDA